MTQQVAPDTAVPNPLAQQTKTEPTAGKETARERFIKELSTNPRFKEAPKSGTGYVIVGAKP